MNINVEAIKTELADAKRQRAGIKLALENAAGEDRGFILSKAVLVREKIEGIQTTMGNPPKGTEIKDCRICEDEGITCEANGTKEWRDVGMKGKDTVANSTIEECRRSIFLIGERSL